MTINSVLICICFILNISQGFLIVFVGLDGVEVLSTANLINTLEGVSFFDFRVILLSLFCLEVQLILGLLVILIFGAPLVLVDLHALSFLKSYKGWLSSACERLIFGWCIGQV